MMRRDFHARPARRLSSSRTANPKSASMAKKTTTTTTSTVITTTLTTSTTFTHDHPAQCSADSTPAASVMTDHYGSAAYEDSSFEALNGAHNVQARGTFAHPALVLSPKPTPRHLDAQPIKTEDLPVSHITVDEHVNQAGEEPDLSDGDTLSSTGCNTPEPDMAMTVPSRPIMRERIFSLFLDQVLTQSSVSRATSKRGMSYLAELLTIDLSSPLLDSAIEAHCLAWMGGDKRDHDALRNAEFAYGQVLHLLGRAVGPSALTRTKRARNLDRAVIASIMLAGLHMFARDCWHTHYQGCQQYLAVRGPAALDLNTHFDRLLFGELRLSLLLIGLASRKPVIFDRPDWRAAIEAQTFDSSVWYSLVMPVPTLLDRVDRLLEHPIGTPRVAERLAAACVRLERLRNNVTHWLHAISPYAGTAPQIVDVVDDESINSNIEEHCFIASSTAFDSYYRFPITPLVFFPLNAWLINLILECTILRILHSPHFDNVESWPIDRDRDDVHRDAVILARNLCRCVHAFSQLPSMVDGSFLLVMLELVRTFHEESEMGAQMGWCQACAIATGVRIRRGKTASEQGALNVDYLKEGIGSAARWSPRRLPIYSG